MSDRLPISSDLHMGDSELECFPYGVQHETEGVCLLVRMGPYRILLDCGLADISPLQQEFQQGLPADLVLCTHAHADHARGLLSLHQAFPLLPIYASEATTHLLPLNWPEIEPLKIPHFCQALPWRSPVEFQDGLTAELFPAGHLPGAAAILLTYTRQGRSYTLFYTGDFFLSNSRLVEGFPLEDLRGLEPDVLVIEGSYGTARHPHRRNQENSLAERINRAIATSYSVLLPTPNLGLGQEILMLLRSHHNFTGRNLDIWVDGSVAKGCDAYLGLLPHLPTSVQNFAKHQSLFWDERVRPRMRRLEPEQRGSVGHPCIIITDETADLDRYCQPNTGPWLILVPEKPGYSSNVTSGPFSHLWKPLHPPFPPVSGESPYVSSPPPPIPLQNSDKDLVSPPVETSPVRKGSESNLPPFRGESRALLKGGIEEWKEESQTEVETYLLAQHSDGPGTTQLIHNLRPKHVIFIHGSPTYLADLACLEELRNRYHLHSPAVGTLVELPIGEVFLQPAAPDTNYEGELNELGTVVTITLPDAITADSRWRNFADTGLVEARWQGDELVLRGLSPRELLNSNGDRFALTDLNCCATCKFQRGQRCWNPDSPLFGFKVTPEGYCPAYERQTEPPTEG